MKDTKNFTKSKGKKEKFNPYSLSYEQAVERIMRYSAEDDNAIGYYLPAFINTPLPHSEPPPGNYKRYNGESIMKLVPDEDYGLPHSGRSRLLIAWMLCKLYANYNIGRKSGVAQIELNKQCRMVFKGTIQELLFDLGYKDDVGGKNGTITYIKEHLNAIINTTYKWPKNDAMKYVTSSRNNFLWAMNQELDWRKHRWADTKSFIEITPTLLQLIDSKVGGFAPFPIDLRAFSALRNSPMAMDLYCWLTRKMYIILNHPKRYEYQDKMNPNRHRFIYSWKALKSQFGAGYKSQAEFARKAKKAIEKIKLLWQGRTYSDTNGITYHGLNVEFPRGRIELLPSPTHVAFDAPMSNFYEAINE